MIRKTHATLSLLCLLLLLCGIAAAAPAPDKDGFVPESRPADMTRPQVDESIPAAPLVAGAYGFIWAAVLVYVGTVAVRARRLEGEIASLRERVGGKGA